MIQRREQMGLALEAREPLRIGGKQLGQDLDGDVAPELRVARTIHFAHAARAESGQDFVRAEEGAGCQGHQRVVGTSRLSSSNQFSTTMMRGMLLTAEPAALIMRYRWPSEETSYVR